MADTWVRPYAAEGGVQEAPGIGVKRSLPRRGGTEPAPYRARRRGVVTPPYGGNMGHIQQTGRRGRRPLRKQCGQYPAAGRRAVSFAEKGGLGRGGFFAKFSAFPLAFSIAIAYNGFH